MYVDIFLSAIIFKQIIFTSKEKMYRYFIQLSLPDLAPVAGELRPLEAVPGVARRQPHLLPPEPRGHQPRSLHAEPACHCSSIVKYI